jgi:hypothetical protein
VRIDPVRLMEQAQPQPTTTDRIREALDRIAAQRTNNSSVADESVRLLRGRVRNGSPSGGELDDPDDPELDSKSDPAV